MNINVNDVLKWRFPDAKFSFHAEENGKIVIDSWISAEPKPSSQAIEQLVHDYKVSVHDVKAQERKNRKKAVLQKLGLTKQDLGALIELIEDRNDD